MAATQHVSLSSQLQWPRPLCFYFQLIAFSHGLLYLPVVGYTHTAGRREEGVWTEPNESLIINRPDDRLLLDWHGQLARLVYLAGPTRIYRPILPVPVKVRGGDAARVSLRSRL